MGNFCHIEGSKKDRRTAKPKYVDTAELESFYSTIFKSEKEDETMNNEEKLTLRYNISNIKCKGLKSLLTNYSNKKKVNVDPYYVLSVKIGEKQYPFICANSFNPIFSLNINESLDQITITNLLNTQVKFTIYELKEEDLAKLLKINRKYSSNPSELCFKVADMIARRYDIYSELITNLLALLIGPENYFLELDVNESEDIKIANAGTIEFKVKMDVYNIYNITLENISLLKNGYVKSKYQIRPQRNNCEENSETILPSIIFREQIYMGMNMEFKDEKYSSEVICLYDTNQLKDDSLSSLNVTLKKENEGSVTESVSKTVSIKTKMMTIDDLYKSILNVIFILKGEDDVSKAVEGYFSLNEIKDKILLNMAELHNSDIENYIKSNKRSEIFKKKFKRNNLSVRDINIVIDNISYSLSFDIIIQGIPNIIQMKDLYFTDNDLMKDKLTLVNVFLDSYESSPRQIPYEQIQPKYIKLYTNIKDINPKDINPKNLQIISGSIEAFRTILLQSTTNEYFIYGYKNIQALTDIIYHMLTISNTLSKLVEMADAPIITSFIEVLKIICERKEMDNKILFEVLKEENLNAKNKTQNTSDRRDTLINIFNEFILNLFEINRLVIEKDVPSTQIFNLAELYGNIFYKYKIARIILFNAFERGCSIEENKKIPSGKEEVNVAPNQMQFKIQNITQNPYDILESPEIIQSTLANNINIYISPTTNNKLFGLPSEKYFSNITIQEAFYMNIINSIFKNYNTSGTFQYPNVCAAIPFLQPIINNLFKQIQRKGLNPKFSFYYWDIAKYFLNDSEILNKLILNIFQKTNAFDYNAVFDAFNFLHSTLSEGLVNSRIKPKIKYDQLQDIVLILLSMDNSLILTHVIWYYYANFQMMDESHLKWFICNVVNMKMMIFLFHWSWKTRLIFTKFIFYCVQFMLGEKREKKGGVNLYKEYVNDTIIEQIKNNKIEALENLKTEYENSGIKLCLIEMGVKDLNLYYKEYEKWRKENENFPDAEPPFVTITLPKEEDYS